MSDGSIRRQSQRGRVRRSDIVIFVTGLIGAAASSIAAYQAVGPYADGPINVGLHRTQDPESGKQLVYREVDNSDGTVLRYLFDNESRKLAQIQVIRIVNGSKSVNALVSVDAITDNARADVKLQQGDTIKVDQRLF